MEQRFVKQKYAEVELREAADGSRTMVGYAAVFNRFSQNLGGFVEQVAPGAFADTLTRGGIVGLVNHDPNWLIATTDSGTLDVAEDERGLSYQMQLDASDPDSLRIAAKIASGKMRGSSFSFRTIADSWSVTEQGFPLRTLDQVELYDVGPVTTPAYRQTEDPDYAVSLRSLSANLGVPLDELSNAARHEGLAGYLTGERNETVEAPASNAAPKLAMARRRFDLQSR